MVSRQVVVGPNLGLIRSVWLVLVRGAGMKQAVCGLGVGLVVSGRQGGAGYIGTHAAPGAQQWGLMLIYSSFSELKLSAPSS